MIIQNRHDNLYRIKKDNFSRTFPATLKDIFCSIEIQLISKPDSERSHIEMKVFKPIKMYNQRNKALTFTLKHISNYDLKTRLIALISLQENKGIMKLPANQDDNNHKENHRQWIGGTYKSV